MAHYINKDVLVVKIEKWINGWTERLNNTNPLNPSFFEGGIAMGKHILSFIDTLAAKEVDLNTDFGVCWGEYCDCGDNINDYKVTKHFF